MKNIQYKDIERFYRFDMGEIDALHWEQVQIIQENLWGAVEDEAS